MSVCVAAVHANCQTNVQGKRSLNEQIALPACKSISFENSWIIIMAKDT